ncbi:hypothetical protein UCRNP2_7352 [Neofusicoccum parvum UCRNP2]|uniref:Uncharacterized protein n=1 Tax=Botryosphaeria parva (strain UCR-NP2) TaxID=1287680 RepID=R1GCG9_BOTPV|nr:hypothetical protein UCRNP2_7352 [Neofusicoccum parvum UCRNP2]
MPAPVAELVEVPLAVPFDAFLSEHNSVFLPVLLRQPGIVYVKTGPFFEALARFTTGPPTIGHYRFGIGSDANIEHRISSFSKMIN